MIIGIDANALTRPFQHGIRRYLEDLIKGISEIDNKNTYIFFSSKKINIPKKKNFRLIIIPKFPVLKRQLFLPLEVNKAKVDVFHNIDSFGPIFLRKPFIVTTVHDMNLGSVYPTFRNVKFFSKRIYSWILRLYTFRNTDRFISVSNATSKELNKYVKKYKLKGKTSVVHEAPSEAFKHNFKNTKDREYFLCMADFSPRKNFESVLKSFLIFQKSTPTRYKLYVVVSTKEESTRISKIVKSVNLKTSIKIFVAPTDKTIVNLYRFATAFIYVSLYEGFGLPILEAMSVGCPVITSNFGATKETAGGAAILVNPRSIQFIAKAMLKFIRRETLRVKMIKRGARRANEFDIKNMASRTIRIYEAVSLQRK